LCSNAYNFKFVIQILLHGANLCKLHEHIDKDLLPAELGGDGPGYHAGKWAEELVGTSLDPNLKIQDEQAQIVR
jgi:hypothetical protein